MSDMKCPFCQQELDADDLLFSCINENCEESFDMVGTEMLWQKVIDLKQELDCTRKALDVALESLKRIDETRSGIKENLHATNGRTLNAGNGFCWATIDDIHNALDKITALEQKDVK